MRRKNRKKHKKIMIFSIIGLLYFFSVGYAAFSSNFLVSGKGTIIEKKLAADILKAKTVTSGEGLYEDSYEEDKYVFKGDNPDNYIVLDGATYRIMSVESDDTIKVVKQYNIAGLSWDEKGNRVASGYCTSTTCNVWGSSTTTLNSVGVNVTSMPRIPGGTSYNLPGNEASLNTYLNTVFLSNLSSKLQNIIENHLFNIGVVDVGSTFESYLSQEQKYKWKGKIGLVNVTDFLRICDVPSTGSPCSSYIVKKNTANMLTITPYVYLSSYSELVFELAQSEILNPLIEYEHTSSERGVWPSFYLKSDIQLTGSGTELDPYCIKGIECNITGEEKNIFEGNIEIDEPTEDEIPIG